MPRVEAPYDAGWLVQSTMAHFGYPSQLIRGVRAPNYQPLLKPAGIADSFDGLEPEIWLKPFQRSAIEWAVANEGGFLRASPGSGKTVMAIWWALSFPGTIVTVTRSGARFQWAGDIRTFSKVEPHTWKPESALRKKDETPQAYFERKRAAGERAWFVVGWDSLVDLQQQLLSFGPSIIVFDEIHRGKAQKRKKWIEDVDGNLQGKALSNTTAAAAALSVAIPYRLGTTATPIVDRTQDYWGQLSLIQPDCWGMTSTKFLERYCDAIPGEFGGIIAQGLTNVEELNNRLSFMRYEIPYQVSHAELPQKRRRFSIVPVEEQVVAVGMGALSKELHGLHKALAKVESEGGSKARAIKDRITEIKIREASSRKRKAVVDRTMANLGSGGKCIVFTGRIEDVGALQVEFQKALAKDKNTTTELLIGHGEIPAETREDIRKQYMAAGSAILIATYQSFGESLNLHDTDYVCVAMLPFRPGDIEQLEGRVYRLGMNRPVLIEYLVAAHTIDTRVKHLILDKMKAVDRLVGGGSALAGLSETLSNSEGREERIAAMAADLFSWYEDSDSDDDED
jgi:hypothetical protein